MDGDNEKKMTLRHKIFIEMRKYWMNVLYITIFFSIFINYKRLILAHYDITYAAYGISILKALVLAKVILILEKLHLVRGFENYPLIIPTLHKASLFSVCAIVVRVAEAMIHGVWASHGLSGIRDGLSGIFTCESFAEMMIVFVSFIPLFAMRELDRVLGEGKLFGLFFKKH